MLYLVLVSCCMLREDWLSTESLDSTVKDQLILHVIIIIQEELEPWLNGQAADL